MPTPSAILRRAAEIVEQGWTRYKLARNTNDEGTSFQDADAVKFCAYGARQPPQEPTESSTPT